MIIIGFIGSIKNIRKKRHNLHEEKLRKKRHRNLYLHKTIKIIIIYIRILVFSGKYNWIGGVNNGVSKAAY